MQTAQKRQCRPKNTWDEVLPDGRKILWIFGFWKMDLATLKTGLNGEGFREEDLSESPTLGRGKWTLTWI